MITALLTRRLRPGALYAIDAVLALIVGAALTPYAALESPLVGGTHEPFWVSMMVGAIIGLPLAVRRRRPVAVAGFITIASVAALLTGVIPSFAAAAPLCSVALAFYTVAASRPLKDAAPIILACQLVLGATLWLIGDDPWFADATPGYATALTSPAWILGWALRERRVQAARGHEQQVRQAAVEERLRVAREMHDVVAHTMSLIVVKAAIGDHVAEARPQEARDALRVIEATGRDAMVEIRRVLAMLREDTPFAPVPGIDDLPRLAEQATLGGVEVRLELRAAGTAGATAAASATAAAGAAGPTNAAGAGVPESVSLAAYRIVQEAVTNVVKHAAPASCRVTVEVRAAAIEIEVVDDGERPLRIGRGGYGLIGMRERTGLHGGDFTAGPRDGGGFRVTARLPYEPAIAVAVAAT